MKPSIVLVLAVLGCAAAATDSAQASLDSELLWGTYRPNLYFGTRPRLANSLLSGVMWFGLDSPQNWNAIRHSCELGDNLSEYGYTRHNGRDFGEQTMRDEDHGVEMTSEFVKVPGSEGGSWAVRFKGRTLESNKQGVSLMYYFGLEGNGSMSMRVDDTAAKIVGKAGDLGRFNIRIVPSPDNSYPPVPQAAKDIPGVAAGKNIGGIALKKPKADVWKIKDIFQEELLESARAKYGVVSNAIGAKKPIPGSILFEMDNVGLAKRGKNMFIAQMVVHGEFSFDVIYECADKAAKIDNNSIGDLVKVRREEFDRRFEASFGLRGKGFDEQHVEMARNALSSLIGGIGYFYGSGLVSTIPKPEYDAGAQAAAEPEPVLSKPYALFAATPSRPFFPRGFLWDEGFHQLVLGQWDSGLSGEIIRSWFHTMDDNGWIAREQILGEEARSKVPKEFQVQYPNFANPPTLLFAVEKIAELSRPRGLTKLSNGLDILEGDDTIVQANGTEDSSNATFSSEKDSLLELSQYSLRLLEFFQKSQFGGAALPDSSDPAAQAARGYRWRGRTVDHTLTSGIDDYPRARPPSEGELHVDLMAWVTYMLSVNADLEMLLDGNQATAESGTSPSGLASRLESHLESLDKIHWNDDENMYCDVATRVREDYDELEDDSDSAEERVFVCHKGYVSLFPMLLGLVPPESDKLGHILDMIENPDELWSDFGLRSLSKSDEFYGKDENYWRGPVWINVNYLVLSSLYRNYMSVDGPHKEQAQRIYSRLRDNLIQNIFSQYKSTRFFWEQYNPETGKGQGTHPFTGWTTLVLPIMAESY
ncbi:Processing alpha glucosidase I [Coemansia sp. Benny D115]|nr:Processing alpha glucosidase I [Coemansia sp. Benny D115]